ncbi:hypothetical protein P280DRAFT_391931 [Massarina eburnea CBS 473.64]|uniref:Myb-like domain-containing protein n=1 Tax=Massarina eburnea CBS 473.64 TaxID=1395130 RepID=A0A6A6SC35_9PLEO|nr:hypothetical protein P280DRAFT_391931 [Massarina eburnea CBS 473.64]
MADRRAARSTSRRNTTPQPTQPTKPAKKPVKPAKADSQPGRTRVEPPVEAAKSTRRSARQASVASVASNNNNNNNNNANGSEQTADAKRRTKRSSQKQAVADLEPVEELDTQLEIKDAPQTPPRPAVSAMHQSPGALSEMSGTTAISSFSMVQAEMLEGRLIMRHLPRLHEATSDFLDHLVPDEPGLDHLQKHMRNDEKRINYMQMPDSTFTIDYNDFDGVLSLHLAHFRGDHQYIYPRAIHTALFGSNHNVAASQTGLDLIIYQANLAIITKDMIHTDRSSKTAWDSIRGLEYHFPALFLADLDPNVDASTSVSGDSALLQETFALALDLRTQLAILWLIRRSNDDEFDFDPDGVLADVFLRGSVGVDGDTRTVRGWGVPALGGEDAPLPEAFSDQVVERCKELRKYCEEPTLGEGGIDLDGIGAAFPWRLSIIRLLSWARLRKAELRRSLANMGGIGAIREKIQSQIQKPGPVEEPAPAPRSSPRKKRPSRTSFGNRRRSLKKFDPLADVDAHVINTLRGKERPSNVQTLDGAQDQDQAQPETEPEPSTSEALQTVEKHPQPAAQDEEDSWVTIVNETLELEQATAPSQPPKSTQEILDILKQPPKTGKENRMRSNLFERQPGAVRHDFGDGFSNGHADESQPKAGPSRQPHQPQASNPKKRSRPVDSDSEDEAAFEKDSRPAKVQQQREKAKRVRIAPPSSSAPPRAARNGSVAPAANKPVATTFTAEPLPAETFAFKKTLARDSSRPKPRKQKQVWTPAQEDALVAYMTQFPHQYARILKHDEAEGEGVLEGRTQVQLKDKVRNMAITMIKSGCGLHNGFEDVINKSSTYGQRLLEEGYDW